ncbi:MAG: hypothetical protein N2441_07540 [Rhodocyclaceae bacterium]|nr:hypothetical protein [Rhodocyclaceae bacterium]
MIFQPAILALILAAVLSLAMLTGAFPFAVQVIRHWDVTSGSERQLMLERRTYLFSTLVAFVCLLQLFSTLLYVFTADKLAVMFVGAMCAVGSLNVNPFGFPTLYLQLSIFFLAAIWLVLNHADNQARDYPLVRIKYAYLIALWPFLAANLWLMLSYFLALKADVITSCCGSLFSEGSSALAAEISTLAPLPAMAIFFGGLLFAIGAAFWHWRLGGDFSGYLTTVGAASGFAAALIGILSFLSLYIYEHPHHHCPFCILQPEYGYLGYALYLPLFAATASGLAVGVLRLFSRRPSLISIIARLSARLAGFTAIVFLLFAVLSSLIVLRSRLYLFS